jgi:hypothetical protein
LYKAPYPYKEVTLYKPYTVAKVTLCAQRHVLEGHAVPFTVRHRGYIVHYTRHYQAQRYSMLYVTYLDTEVASYTPQQDTEVMDEKPHPGKEVLYMPHPIRGHTVLHPNTKAKLCTYILRIPRGLALCTEPRQRWAILAGHHAQRPEAILYTPHLETEVILDTPLQGIKIIHYT